MTQTEKNEYQKKWRQKNKDKVQTYASRAKDYQKEYGKTYRKENRERIKKLQEVWRQNNPKKCQNYYRNSVLKIYGITPQEYDALLKNQNGKCAICRRPHTDFERRLHVDHDHSTGKVRGLLCVKCNQGIGYLDDCPELLERARQYLLRSKKEGSIANI